VIQRGARRTILGAIFMAIGAILWFVPMALHQSLPASKQPQDAVKVGFAVGDRAPDFELRSLDGHTVKLRDLQGKPVLLNFWATWCAPCRVEMPWLVELDQRYRAQGLQIVGISLDDSGSTKEVSTFVTQRGVQYQILLGDSATANEYGGVRFMPQSFFIDADGKIRKATTGLIGKQSLEDDARALLSSRSGPQAVQGGQP